MLSSWIFLYSGVRGASWARPGDLLGSNLTRWPGRRGAAKSHSPFQFGYFESSARDGSAAAASPAADTRAMMMRRMRGPPVFDAWGPAARPDPFALPDISGLLPRRVQSGLRAAAGCATGLVRKPAACHVS